MPPPTPSREAVLAAALTRREARRRRPRAVRAVQATLGSLLLLASLPLLVLLPEAGVPLLLLALQRLADEFRWAARAYARVTWSWSRFHAWFTRQRLAVKAFVIALTLAALGTLLALLLLH